jgi:hypothetical protein
MRTESTILTPRRAHIFIKFPSAQIIRRWCNLYSTSPILNNHGAHRPNFCISDAGGTESKKCNSHFAFLKRRASAPAPLDKHTNDLCIHAMHIQYRARRLQRGATSLLRAHPLLFIFLMWNASPAAENQWQNAYYVYSARGYVVFYERVIVQRIGHHENQKLLAFAESSLNSLRVGDQLEEKNYPAKIYFKFSKLS